MKVLVSGGTGLLGQGFLKLLRDSRRHEVGCFVRRASPIERPRGLELAYGNAVDISSLEQGIAAEARRPREIEMVR